MINYSSAMVLTGFSGLLYVESVGDESEVRVNEAESLGHVLLHVVAGVEHQLQPSTKQVTGDQQLRFFSYRLSRLFSRTNLSLSNREIVKRRNE